jgi:hypothetical protein
MLTLRMEKPKGTEWVDRGAPQIRIRLKVISTLRDGSNGSWHERKETAKGMLEIQKGNIDWNFVTMNKLASAWDQFRKSHAILRVIYITINQRPVGQYKHAQPNEVDFSGNMRTDFKWRYHELWSLDEVEEGPEIWLLSPRCAFQEADDQ